MEFINKLFVTATTINVERQMGFDEDYSFRMYMPINLPGGISLSVQASYAHYCSPRRTIKNPLEYTTMEFAIFDPEKGMSTVKQLLPDFKRLKEIEEYQDDVYGFVPVELIEDLYQALKTK